MGATIPSKKTLVQKKQQQKKPTKKPQEKYQNLSEEERKENTRYDRQRYKKPPGNDERNVGWVKKKSFLKSLLWLNLFISLSFIYFSIYVPFLFRTYLTVYLNLNVLRIG